MAKRAAVLAVVTLLGCGRDLPRDGWTVKFSHVYPNVIGFVTDRFYEVGKYFSFTSITYNPITLVVNERFFQSLPESVREDVLTSAKEAFAYQSEVALELEREAFETMKAEKVVVSYPDPDRFVPLVRPKVWEALAARLPDGRRLLERLQQALDETSVE